MIEVGRFSHRDTEATVFLISPVSSVPLWQIQLETKMPSIKAGSIGLVRMGLPMSYRLLAAGIDLVVHNRSQSKVHEISAAGSRAAPPVAEVVREAEVVLVCLPDVATWEEIFLGDASAS